jgi:hypothetical protein
MILALRSYLVITSWSVIFLNRWNVQLDFKKWIQSHLFGMVINRPNKTKREEAAKTTLPSGTFPQEGRERVHPAVATVLVQVYRW